METEKMIIERIREAKENQARFKLADSLWHWWDGQIMMASRILGHLQAELQERRQKNG